MTEARPSTAPIRDVPVDWEALEDAFENNAPEVHSYLHLTTGEVLRVVDGVADPQMHARISADTNYLRIDPVSSREQYRWMERFIPMVDEGELKNKLAQAIDGKGAFRRFKDVLMTFSADRERWFAFRGDGPPSAEDLPPDSLVPLSTQSSPSLAGVAAVDGEAPKSQSGRRARNADALRQSLKELGDVLGPRELDLLVSFAEFLKARRAARGFAHHHEHMLQERETAAASVRGAALAVQGIGTDKGSSTS